MSFKLAHKVLAKEITSANIVTSTAPKGKNSHQGLNWASLSGGEQAQLTGRAKDRLGQ